MLFFSAEKLISKKKCHGKILYMSHIFVYKPVCLNFEEKITKKKYFIQSPPYWPPDFCPCQFYKQLLYLFFGSLNFTSVETPHFNNIDYRLLLCTPPKTVHMCVHHGGLKCY